MPYNMFLEISVFLADYIQNALIGLITYTKIAKV